MGRGRDVHAVSILQSFPDHVREAMGLYERLVDHEAEPRGQPAKPARADELIEHSLG